MIDIAILKLHELKSPRERLIGPIAMVWSALIWLAVIISLVGIIYALMGLVFALIAQAVFLAAIRGNAVRVTARQFPDLYARLEKICKRLELEQVPETYVVQAGGLLNAMAAKLLSCNFVLIYSNLIEACGDDEGALDFVVAHEIGHIALGHLKRRGLLLPAAITPWLGPGLSRAHEYSADRCGLAGCGDIESANRAIGILAAGGQMARSMDMEAFMDQRLQHGDFWFAVVELASTHPLLPKRVAALREMLNPGSVARVGRNPLAYLFAPLLGPFAQPAGGAATGLVVIAIVGMMAAIAIPNFLKFQARARQSEAKVELRGLFSSEKAHFADHMKFGTLKETEWAPTPGNRYTYHLGGEVIPSAAGASPVPAGVESYLRADGFQAVAVGNIDGDATLDVWTINDENQLENIVNDVTEQ